MTCALKNSQPAIKWKKLGRGLPRERGRSGGGGMWEDKGGWGWDWIDTHCLSHLGIQPTVIQVLSKRNWRMTHWEFTHRGRTWCCRRGLRSTEGLREKEAPPTATAQHRKGGEGYFYTNDSFASWRRHANELLLRTARERGEVKAALIGGKKTSLCVGGSQQMTRLIAGSAGWLMCFYE